MGVGAATHPLVSIVTPCFNMAQFLRETIESVLDQDYPNIEYIIMDGGSTDGTLEILEEYKDRLHFESRADLGTADAINRGFQRSNGAIFAYLNADDTYLPGAVAAAVRHLQENADCGVVYGEGWWVDANGNLIGRYPTKPFDRELLSNECFVCQPATFVRREVFERAGKMDPCLNFVFDYDLWIRVAKVEMMSKVDGFWATSRMYPENKTLRKRAVFFEETMQTLMRHYGYVGFQWVYGFAGYLIDRRDQFFEPFRPSFVGYALSLVLGLRYNWRQPIRYIREWHAVMSVEGLVRLWGSRRAYQVAGGIGEEKRPE